MCEYIEGTFSIEAPLEMKELFEKLGYKPYYITELIEYEVKPLQDVPEIREKRFDLIKRCLERSYNELL